MKNDAGKRYEWYLEWKALGLKRCCSQELAEKCGVSRQALNNWSKRPIEINGVKYANWSEAYFAETETIRENLKTEIDAKLAQGYEIAELWANEVYLKMYEEVKNKNYRPTDTDKKLATQIIENLKNRVNGTQVNNPVSSDTLAVSIGFRGDKVGDS